MTKRQRVGGMKADPEVQSWADQAAPNLAAMSKKEQAEAKRVRVYYDVPRWLKEAGERAAEREQTTASQMGAFLLAWAQQQYWAQDEALLEALENSKQPSPSLRIDWNVDIPVEIQRAVTDGST